jgi:hypothetical protein
MAMVILVIPVMVVLMVRYIMVMSMPEVRSETAVSFNWQERLS